LSWLNVFGIAVALAMDAFAVAIAAGLAIDRLTHRHVFRLAWHFGLFQFLMPVIGWLAGRTVSSHIAAWDHWVAFGLLSFIGLKMLYQAWRGPGGRPPGDPTRGWMLVTLSVATSIDALAVGLSMAFLDVAIWLPSVVIGVVAGALTWFGIVFGSRLGRLAAGKARWAEALGGAVLLAIGIRIIVCELT